MARSAARRKQPLNDLHEWLIGWRVAVARELVPVSWPAEAGPQHAGASCSCCRTASWWLNASNDDSGGWVCARCHPPPAQRGDVQMWSAATDTSVKTEGPR